MLTTNLPERGLQAGAIGTVVMVHQGGQGYTVEFLALRGETVAVITVPAKQIRPIRTNEITHVRDSRSRGRTMSNTDSPDYLAFAADWNDPTLVALYDELPLWSALFGALLLRHVPLRRGMTVLDVGCGTGFPLLELAQRLGSGSTVYGVDPWDAALERARQKAARWNVTNVVFLPGDAAALPLPDQHLDLIVSNLGLNNFADPAAVLQECRRVARPGATLVLTTNLQGHMQEFYAVFAAVLQDLGDHAALERLATHIAHRTTVARLTEQLTAAQFQITRVVEESAVWRFADGSACLRHFFIKRGFLNSWKGVLQPGAYAEVFRTLEAALNAHAARQGELSLSIPMAYVEARRCAE